VARGAFTIGYTDSAAHELGDLSPRIRRRLRRKIESIRADPRGARDAAPLWGEWEGHWKLVVGEYRVIYRIEDREARVVIVRIRHRSQAYDRGNGEC
jgi:mRNA interferase RelE/StbE